MQHRKLKGWEGSRCDENTEKVELRWTMRSRSRGTRITRFPPGGGWPQAGIGLNFPKEPSGGLGAWGPHCSSLGLAWVCLRIGRTLFDYGLVDLRP